MMETTWLPQSLIDKPTAHLSLLLSSPSLLTALSLSPPLQPPSPPYTHPFTPLTATLNQNIALSTALLALHARLVALRAELTTQLLALHALHARWRSAQERMDRALAPFSPGGLYQNLVAKEREVEGWTAGVEGSFLEGPQHGGVSGSAKDGEWSEREVGEWVRRFREGRKQYWLRRERRGRWDEGRVGGWR